VENVFIVYLCNRFTLFRVAHILRNEWPSCSIMRHTPPSHLRIPPPPASDPPPPPHLQFEKAPLPRRSSSYLPLTMTAPFNSSTTATPNQSYVQDESINVVETRPSESLVTNASNEWWVVGGWWTRSSDPPIGIERSSRRWSKSGIAWEHWDESDFVPKNFVNPDDLCWDGEENDWSDWFYV
jgi:hypothetical protein